MTRSVLKNRWLMAWAYVAAATLGPGLHDHGSEAGHADRDPAAVRCAENRAHYDGIPAAEPERLPDHCAACKFQVDHHALIDGPAGVAARIAAEAEPTATPLATVALRRPHSARAPPA